jgi:hypothetical protein
MSLLKYDGYRDYVAGLRFAESLAGWLSQFDLVHCAMAYDFVKHRLIYFSPLDDQIVLATHIDEDKWKDLGAKLREDQIFESDGNPKFDRVCLVDDFTGSGTSFLRQRKDKSWTGKLRKFGLGLAADEPLFRRCCSFMCGVRAMALGAKVASKADSRAIISRSFPRCQRFPGGFRFRHRRRSRPNILCLGSPACFRQCRWRDVAPGQ